MGMTHDEEDKRFIARCIELSKEALARGDGPFGSLVARDGFVIAEGVNDAQSRVSDHAEVLALHHAQAALGTTNLTGCTLYTNCEPCPMCAFMAREYKVSRVVFALPSPFVGGYTKWPILQDTEMTGFAPFFKEPPEVVSGVLEPEAKAVFDTTPLWMFGTHAREEGEKRKKGRS